MREAVTAAVLAILLLPLNVLAQEPVERFDQLNTRLKIGDKVYVTDTLGRERQGKVLALTPSSVTLDSGGRQTLSISEVSLVEDRRPDSLKHGALIGLAVGAAVGAGIAAAVCSSEECDAGGLALGVGLYAAMGAGIGTGIDAMIPGRKRVVYQVAKGDGSASFRLTPVITPRRQGIALSLSF